LFKLSELKTSNHEDLESDQKQIELHLI